MQPGHRPVTSPGRAVAGVTGQLNELTLDKVCYKVEFNAV